MRILLDFDGTLCPDPCNTPPATPPALRAARVLRDLSAAGHTIIVLSCRAHGSAGEGWRARAAAREIAAYLRLHDVPFDEILTGKPHADAIIDERALAFDGDWRALGRLLRRGLRLFAARPRDGGEGP